MNQARRHQNQRSILIKLRITKGRFKFFKVAPQARIV